MKVVIQRVKSAMVIREENKSIVGEIKSGLFVLLGIKKGDTKKQADEIINKMVKLRIMADEEGKMNLSVIDTKSEILLVSQFTLYANTKDGNRPSFMEAEEPLKAKIIYEYIVESLQEKNVKVATGSFGDYMKIDCVLDGPVTLVLEN
ncbi:MAG: D-aminoacyl-tRNA deacylase [bacterium]|nr:MAG: D-aminoacyl-tRNA deacylase [bacterium]